MGVAGWWTRGEVVVTEGGVLGVRGEEPGEDVKEGELGVEVRGV